MGKITSRPSARTRRAEWLAQNRLRQSFERSLAAKLTKELDRTGREAATKFKRSGRIGAMKAHRKRTKRIMETHYMGVGLAFGERFLDSVNASNSVDGSRSARPAEAKASEEQLGELSVQMGKWISTEGGKRIVAITRTTENRINRQIQRGVAEGLGQDEVARNIVRSTGKAIGRRRARTIARTETHTASQVAVEASVEAEGLGNAIIREWIASGDENTRETHSSASGQRRKPGVPFNVGGAALMFPGDPGGPPEETINCRCVLLYIPSN